MTSAWVSMKKIDYGLVVGFITVNHLLLVHTRCLLDPRIASSFFLRKNYFTIINFVVDDQPNLPHNSRY